MIYVYMYLALGFIYGWLTLREQLDWIDTKYPQFRTKGVTKKQKMMIAVGRMNAYGFATVIHVGIMMILWLPEVVYQLIKRGKK